MNITPISFTAAGNINNHGNLGPSNPFPYREKIPTPQSCDTFERSALFKPMTNDSASEIKQRLEDLKTSIGTYEDTISNAHKTADDLIFYDVVLSDRKPEEMRTKDINEALGEAVNARVQLYAARKELLYNSLKLYLHDNGAVDGLSGEYIDADSNENDFLDLQQRLADCLKEKIPEGFEQYCESGIEGVVDKDVRNLINLIVE